jgi:hypothetical protein
MVLGAAKLYLFTLLLFGQDILRLGSSYCTLNRLLFCMRTLSALCVVCEREIVYTYIYYVSSESSIKLLRILHERVALYVLHVCYFRPGRF